MQCHGKSATCNYGFCQGGTCNAKNCPTGCCSFGTCEPGNQNFACGTGGAKCQSCFSYYGYSPEVCQDATCVATACDFYSCPNGCCDAEGKCQKGNVDSACGTFGNACIACAGGASCISGSCVGGFTCNATTCPLGCCDGAGNCRTGLGITGGSTCPCSSTCTGCCDSSNNCHAGTTQTECGGGGATCQDCTALGESCDTYAYPRQCDSTCPSPYMSCPGGTTEATPATASVCHAFDITDAETACTGGASTFTCQSFFYAEDSTNPGCASCLRQFDVDWAELTGIYLCAQPFLSASCNGSTGCASDCLSKACSFCPSVATCDMTAIAGECSSYVTAGNACVAASSSASSLCSSSGYANFGAWLAAVGAHYCE